MKVHYEFLTGKRTGARNCVNVEVSDELGAVILELERQEHNRNRAETRRHISYSDENDKIDSLMDNSVDKELSQLYYLNREIEEQQRRLRELEELATSCTANITGMPRVDGISDKVAKYAAEIVDLKRLMDLNDKNCFYELNRLNVTYKEVEDSQIRTILSLRYINGLSWKQIAFSIGGVNTEDGVKKAAYRYLKNN